MSDWTDKYAIMRDLAEAQGFDVPADLEGIGANEKPPAPNIPDETGEDYFGHREGEGEGDCSGPPDLALIKQMLDMVRDVDISQCEGTSDQLVQITKPSNPNIGIDITNTKTGTIPKNEKPQTKKVKKKRENCALNSILLAISNDTPILNMERPKEQIKLLKPTDFISDSTETEMTQSVNKVNGWLDTQVPSTSVSRFSGNPLLLEPGSMFKRKSSSTVKSLGSDKSTSPQKQGASTSYKPSILPEDTKRSSSSLSKASVYQPALEPSSMFKTKSSSSLKSPESLGVQSPPPSQQVTTIASYKPSVLAGEYYQKYVERNKMKELVQENIWSAAERIMKEKDAKALEEAEDAALKAALLASTKDETAIDTAAIDTAAIDTATIDTAAIDEATIDISAIEPAKVPGTMEFLESNQNRDAPSRNYVELPQHRHLLTGECIVCKVVKDHGYDVDAEIYGNVQ